MIVIATEVFEAAIRSPARKVSGFVQPRIDIFSERIIDKALGRQRFTIQITARHPGPADVQLANHADRYRFALSIEDIQLQIGNTHANRADAEQLRVGGLQRSIGHVHGGFGDAVHVHQPRAGIADPRIPRLEQARLQRFAAEHHLP
ncbi:hypothetical protein D3C81_1727650 [compost metagenome]